MIQDYLVSPADGLITQIVETNGPKEFSLENKKFTRVSIFMSTFSTAMLTDHLYLHYDRRYVLCAWKIFKCYA